MLIKQFLLHFSPQNSMSISKGKPGFYIKVEYTYDKYGHFIEVTDIVINYKLIGIIELNEELAKEIEIAARNNFENTVKKVA